MRSVGAIISAQRRERGKCSDCRNPRGIGVRCAECAARHTARERARYHNRPSAFAAALFEAAK